MPKPEGSTSTILDRLYALNKTRTQLDNWFYQYSSSSLSIAPKVTIGMALPNALPVGLVLCAACVIATHGILTMLDITPPKEVYTGAIGCGLALTTLYAWYAGDRIQKGYNDLEDSIKKTEEELVSIEDQLFKSKGPS
jgi:hypothetical protein